MWLYVLALKMALDADMPWNLHSKLINLKNSKREQRWNDNPGLEVSTTLYASVHQPDHHSFLTPTPSSLYMFDINQWNRVFLAKCQGRVTDCEQEHRGGTSKVSTQLSTTNWGVRTVPRQRISYKGGWIMLGRGQKNPISLPPFLLITMVTSNKPLISPGSLLWWL